MNSNWHCFPKQCSDFIGAFVSAQGCRMRGLTFELSRPRRRGAWAARRMMTLAASRPKCPASVSPRERRVGPRWEHDSVLRWLQTAFPTPPMLDTLRTRFQRGPDAEPELDSAQAAGRWAVDAASDCRRRMLRRCCWEGLGLRQRGEGGARRCIAAASPLRGGHQAGVREQCNLSPTLEGCSRSSRRLALMRQGAAP